MNTHELPYPRLELRWKKIEGEKPYPEASYSYDILCEYLLVISPPNQLDIRSNIEHDDHTEYGGKAIEVLINSTKASGKITEEDGSIRTPFRDSVHIVRDAKVLNLPAFVTFEDMAQPIVIYK